MDTSTALKPDDFLPYFQMLEKAKAGPAKILLDALGLIEADGALAPSASKTSRAVDLGCGTGKDTVELLRRNWHVLAVDFSQAGIDALLKRPEATQFQTNLETQVASFADAKLGEASLVVALLSLPYGPADTFDKVWQSVVSSLLTGGYFVGHFFGPEHYKGMNHVVRRSKSEVEEMLSQFEVLRLQEMQQTVEHEGQTTHYHYFDVIARKKVVA